MVIKTDINNIYTSFVLANRLIDSSNKETINHIKESFGRSYGYHKKTKNLSVVLPSNKTPLCNVGCTRQFISLECRQETFGFENGVRCQGCDIDICRGRGDNFNRWQDNERRENNGRWRNRDQGIDVGFIDNIQNDFINQGQRLNQGRSYGDHKKTKKVTVALPSNKTPLCNVGCTRQFISLECRQETFGFENGVRCQGCDIDICRGRGDNFNRWQDNERRENNGRWRNQDQGIDVGFIDNIQNDIINQGQRLNQGEWSRNRFDTRVNRQFRNEWN
ncbi:unnamed protein product [Mytilus edulis]|uniref:Uncharacterized protein n=1 Tax=Mytilus edulis TaxID=6550 RepID=A0A8S3R7H5_MYTED|nr:unnamed protein product [Mytilus edulis]